MWRASDFVFVKSYYWENNSAGTRFHKTQNGQSILRIPFNTTLTAWEITSRAGVETNVNNLKLSGCISFQEENIAKMWYMWFYFYMGQKDVMCHDAVR